MRWSIATGARWGSVAAMGALALCGSLAMAATAAPAVTAAAKAQYAADSKQAQAQYDADKKLCTDEPTGDARLQCRRDAKAAYDKLVTDAKARLAAAPKEAPASAAAAATAPACPECGVVVAVSETERAGEGTALGMIAGGVGGAILGNQVGGGFGKDLATIAGAAGGAYAGKKIEEKARAYKVWTVRVRYGDASERAFEYKESPGLRVGDEVKNSGTGIVRR